jgi:hypothetical protein
VILDFSGVAKGYAVDRLAAVLKSVGVPRFLIEIGGELVGEGVQPDGQPWWVEAENPPDAPLPSMRIALCGMAVATSGNYRRWLNVGDRRFGHTIDPRDGRPFDNGMASATVLHRQCAVADALATALCVLGPEQGMDYAKARGLAARFVLFGDGVWSERLTPALAAMLDPMGRRVGYLNVIQHRMRCSPDTRLRPAEQQFADVDADAEERTLLWSFTAQALAIGKACGVIADVQFKKAQRAVVELAKTGKLKRENEALLAIMFLAYARIDVVVRHDHNPKIELFS